MNDKWLWEERLRIKGITISDELKQILGKLLQHFASDRYQSAIDVLDDLNAGKTIRRKSWHPDWGVGKYARYGKIIYLDLLADDWESVDVVAEVNKNQQDIIDGKY